MTRAPSSTNLESPADPGSPAPFGSGTQACVERLEFGKFCVDPDGPVEKDEENVPIEHGQLGWSRGFPEELIRFCDPSIMGASTGDLDPPPKHCPHGTVMRPVVPDGGTPRSVFYRVQTRPEAGEDQPGRRYIMARYMVARDDGLSPLALLNLMDDDKSRLRGVTREEAAVLDAFTPSVARPVLSPAGEAFCRGALVYILSGIPVSVLEEVTEREFFSWVAVLWALLPPALRVQLSAGWGVGNAFSGRLAVTHTALGSPDCALFSPFDPHTSEPVWTPPQYVTIWTKHLEHLQPNSHEFFERRLEPGHFYTRFFFDSEVEWPVSPPPTFDKEALSIINSSDFEFPELPDWDHHLTIRAFRYPGLKVRDEFTFLDIKDWLKTGQYEENVLPLLNLRQSMTYELTRERTLHLMRESLAQPNSKRRADRALWIVFSWQHPESFASLIEDASGPWAARTKLLAALSQRDTLRALQFLRQTGEREKGEEADDLLAEVVQRLQECLDDSLERSTRQEDAAQPSVGNATAYLTPHAELLRLQPPPAVYCEWLGRRGLHLMRAFALSREPFGEVPHADILRISPSSDRRALYEMLFGVKDLQAALAAVGTLSEEEYQIFSDVFIVEWARSDAQRREYLLGWFRALGLLGWFREQGLIERLNPLLLIDAGEPLSHQWHFETLMNEIEGMVVPPSLEDKVSAACLMYFEQIRRRIWAWRAAEKGGWLLVLRRWLWLDAEALCVRINNSLPAPPEMERVSREMSLSPVVLNELLRMIKSETFPSVAGRYWEWADRYWQQHPDYQPDESSRPQAMELCWYLRNEMLPPQMPCVIADVKNAVELVRASGLVKTLQAHAQGLWQSATEGWQFMLLLTLFQDEKFNPSPLQLGDLAPNYAWLGEHLNEQPERRADFEVASASFHSFAYKQHMDRWRDAFRDSVIWAAFKGVPEVQRLPRGALAEALEHYHRIGEPPTGRQRELLIREVKSRMCRDFIDAYQRLPSFDPALERVLREFIIPELIYYYGKKQENIEYIFLAFIAKLKHEQRKNTPRIPQGIDGEFYDLIQLIVRNTSSETIWTSIDHLCNT